MTAYSVEILDEADHRGVAPYVVYTEKKKRERDLLMAQARRPKEVTLQPATLTERIVAASLGTVALLFGIYLIVDLIMGWGMGFIVGAFTALAIAVVGAFVAIVALWRWVYKGSGRYQMGKS